MDQKRKTVWISSEERLSPSEKVLLVYLLGVVSALAVVGTAWNFGILIAQSAGAG